MKAAIAELQAHGFAVTTRDVKVVDCGTDFAVVAHPDSSLVQVIQGEVDLFKPNQDGKAGV